MLQHKEKLLMCGFAEMYLANIYSANWVEPAASRFHPLPSVMAKKAGRA